VDNYAAVFSNGSIVAQKRETCGAVCHISIPQVEWPLHRHGFSLEGDPNFTPGAPFELIFVQTSSFETRKIVCLFEEAVRGGGCLTT
jgi:hypothetical protein